MAKKIKAEVKKIEFPRHMTNVYEEAKVKYDAIAVEFNAMYAQVMEHLANNFKLAGGCEKCRGRGWVVVWDTMDMMDGSCAEYGACPNVECTEETRKKSGLHPVYTKYDGLQGTKNPFGEVFKKAYGHLTEAHIDARLTCERLDKERYQFIKGDKVVVTRGRKVLLGTIGVIAYIGEGYVLIKDEAVWQDRNANGTWVYTSNLERLV